MIFVRKTVTQRHRAAAYLVQVEGLSWKRALLRAGYKNWASTHPKQLLRSSWGLRQAMLELEEQLKIPIRVRPKRKYTRRSVAEALKDCTPELQAGIRSPWGAIARQEKAARKVARSVAQEESPSGTSTQQLPQPAFKCACGAPVSRSGETCFNCQAWAEAAGWPVR